MTTLLPNVIKAKQRPAQLQQNPKTMGFWEALEKYLEACLAVNVSNSANKQKFTAIFSYLCLGQRDPGPVLLKVTGDRTETQIEILYLKIRRHQIEITRHQIEIPLKETNHCLLMPCLSSLLIMIYICTVG